MNTPQILLEPFRKDCDRVLTPSLLLIDQQISPRFDVNEKTLPALSSEDYADLFVINLNIFRRLRAYIGIIRTSA